MAFTLRRVDLHRPVAAWYSEYLESDRWRTFRAKIIAERGALCEWCNEVPHYSLHHKTYARLFNEIPADVILVCKDCHDYCHKNHNIPLLPWIYEPDLNKILMKLRNTRAAPVVDEPKNR